MLPLPLLLFQVAARPTPAPTPTPVPGEVRVAVTVYGPDQKKSLGAGAVVWIPGAKRIGLAAPDPKPQIASQNKRFTPRIVAVPVGATVEFPNLDRIHHNVFSLSEKAKFDLGLYKNGASKPVTFTQSGVVRVFCNIHPQMAAFVVVVDGEVYTTAGADGVAVLTGVPPGKKSVKVWDERGGEWSGTVDVLAGRSVPLAVTLDGSAFHDVPHKNKYGKEYPPPDDDENRY